jgi:hypothetical protein
MGEGGSEESFIVNEKSNGRLNKFVQNVLNVVRKVHGAGDVQVFCFIYLVFISHLYLIET